MTRPVYLPKTFDELWEIRADRPEAAVFAGGTDILVMMRSGRIDPPALIGLEKIRELRRFEDTGDRIFIGAGLTHAELLEDLRIGARLPVLGAAIEVLGSPPIRHMGTIGGNVITASPAGDTLPPLYVLDAQVELLSPKGKRRIFLKDFITGPGRTAIDPDEILSGIWINADAAWDVSHFEKVGTRNALAIAVVSLAALVKFTPDGRVQEARLAWGSVGPTVVTSSETEAAIIDRPLDDRTLEKAAESARQAVAPINDIRASAEYRRAVAGNLVRRLSTFQPVGRITR